MLAVVKMSAGNVGQVALVAMAALLGSSAELSATSFESVTVYSENCNGYKRVRLSDGTVKPETFAFGEGERFDSHVANNDWNELSFRRVVTTLAKPLAQRGYLAAPDANHTDLLILVYWGVTDGTRNTLPLDRGDMTSQFDSAGGLKGAQDFYNARLLGYTSKLQFAMDVPWFTVAQDIFDEIQENRYFVILQAFDFQLLRKEHRQKLLWETRISITERGNNFGEELAGMAQRASQYFGSGNGRLVRRAYPKGHVEVGTPVEVK